MSEKICGIYQFQSKIKPERIYIGSSTDIKSRRRQHFYDLRHDKHHNPILQHHFNKYGEFDMGFFIVEQFSFISKEHILEREKYYLNTLNPWFNVLRETCNTRLGIPHTPEVCRKMSEFRKGKPSCKKGIKTGFVPKSAFPKGHIPWSKGKVATPETIERLRNSHLGKPGARLGCHLTEEQKENLRQKNIGKKRSQETKDKVRKKNIMAFFERVYSEDGDKRCAHCEEYFGLNYFINNNRTYDGLHYYCNKCRKQTKKESKIRNRKYGRNI